MGIAIAIIYVPIFLVCSLISVLAAIQIYKVNKTIAPNYHSNKLPPNVIGLLGVALTITSCLFLLWAIPIDDQGNGFIENLAISLLGPMLIGFLTFMVSLLLKERKRVVLSLMASGSFFSSPIFPVIAYYYFAKF